MPHEARPTPPPVVTLSGGVSCWTPGSRLSVPELLRQADEALFQAKSAGRNRVHVSAVHDDNVVARAPISI